MLCSTDKLLHKHWSDVFVAQRAPGVYLETEDDIKAETIEPLRM